MIRRMSTTHRIVIAGIVLGLGLSAAAAAAGSDPNSATGTNGLILVDKVGRQIRFLDPSTFKEVSSFPAGVAPHDVAISPDHTTAYTPIYGDGIYGRNPNPGHEIAIIDLASREQTQPVQKPQTAGAKSEESPSSPRLPTSSGPQRAASASSSSLASDSSGRSSCFAREPSRSFATYKAAETQASKETHPRTEGSRRLTTGQSVSTDQSSRVAGNTAQTRTVDTCACSNRTPLPCNSPDHNQAHPRPGSRHAECTCIGGNRVSRGTIESAGWQGKLQGWQARWQSKNDGF
jgi:hypothetical protein